MSNDILTITKNPQYNKTLISYPNGDIQDRVTKKGFQTFTPYSSTNTFIGKNTNSCEEVSSYGTLFKTITDVCGNRYDLFKDIETCSIREKREAHGTLCINNTKQDNPVINIHTNSEYIFIIYIDKIIIKGCLTEFECELTYNSSASLSLTDNCVHIFTDEEIGQYHIHKLDREILKKITTNPLIGIDFSFTEIKKTIDSFYVVGQTTGGNVVVIENYDDDWCGFISNEIYPSIICCLMKDCSLEFYHETGVCPNSVSGFCFNMEDTIQEDCLDLDCGCISKENAEIKECLDEYLN